ncbi:hypothetical protein [Pseudomonas sp. UMAB-40]|uniref:hypothetical protein n=1 Tax=Pseudomonas sp. UMAB-40 TaxID=1365407 RepID=UPI001C5945FB|nr:hypothetical protein [Pseudomonas sp. UMAB-40]
MAMAGRKPLNSAIFMKVRSQVILRATAVDIENRTDVVRLSELIEQLKSEGSLNKFVMRALLNQMQREEQSSDAPQAGSAQVQPRPLAVQEEQPQGSVVQLQSYMQAAATLDQEQPRAAPDPVVPALQLPTAEMIIESAMQSLETQRSEVQSEVPTRPKRRMGGNAMTAMGTVD